MTDTDHDLSPMEARLRDACFALWENLSDEQRDELLTLRDLEPDGFSGINVRHGDGVMVVAFAGRDLGTIDREWLLTGHVRPAT